MPAKAEMMVNAPTEKGLLVASIGRSPESSAPFAALRVRNVR